MYFSAVGKVGWAGESGVGGGGLIQRLSTHLGTKGQKQCACAQVVLEVGSQTVCAHDKFGG